MATLYSKQLAVYYSSGSGPNTFAPASESYLWVVRQVTAIHQQPSFDHHRVWLNGFVINTWGTLDPVGPICRLSSSDAVSNMTFTWNGHHVTTAGQGFEIAVGDNDWTFLVSGYELSVP